MGIAIIFYPQIEILDHELLIFNVKVNSVKKSALYSIFIYRTMSRILTLLMFSLISTAVIAQPDVDERRKGRAKTRKTEVAPTKKQPTTEPAKSQPNQIKINDQATIPAAKTVSGIVKDAQTGDPLAGVYIQVEGTMLGTVSNDDGAFTLQLPPLANINLVCSCIGYGRLTQNVPPSQFKLVLELKEEVLMTEEVVVTASRVSERLMESPVTIEKLDLRTIRETPNINVYDAMATTKGADMMSASMGFRVINTRGFNSLTNQRFIHRLDGMDLQAPGLNIPINVLNGANDLDVENIELVPGASSALYGPNAFNGLMEVKTKSPFQYQGLSATVRLGANHLDGKDHAASPFYDFNIRYAHNFKDKFAVKVNFAYFRSLDWYATDYRDAANYAGSDNVARYGSGKGNPGYDGLNLYGDEIATIFNKGFGLPGLNLPNGQPIPLLDHNLRIARTGYQEQDLTNYNTYNIKGDVGLFWRPSAKVEVSLTTRMAGGTALYQSVNRYNLQDFLIGATKAEVKGDRFFVRAYAAYEDAGGTFDTRFTGINLNRAAKTDDNWFPQYIVAYSPITNQILNSILGRLGKTTLRPLNDQDARAFADGDNRYLLPYVTGALRSLGLDSLTALTYSKLMTNGQARFQPGSKEFSDARTQINDNPRLASGGAQFVDHTKFYHAEGQYDFSKLIPFVEITAGGNIRMYDLNSQGTIFPDTNGRKIQVWEFGGYVQATKRLLGNRLRLTASGRLDKSTNFDVYFSPRFAAVVTLGEKRNHNFRISFQRGFRNPVLQNQYLNLDLGTFRYVGGLTEVFNPYKLKLVGSDGNEIINAYDEGTVREFLSTGDSSRLKRANLSPLKPEDTRCFEIGYKANLTEDFFIDAGYYLNWYKDFIVVQALVGPDVFKRNYGPNNDPLLTADDLKNGRSISIRRATNLSQTVLSNGVNLGFSYNLNSKFTVTGNYSFARIISDAVDRKAYIIGFNTPQHKTNIALTARNLLKNKKLGFVVQHRWVDAMTFEETIYTGPLPAYNLLDAQVSYKFPKYKTILRMGGTNILNNRHLEALVSSTIGSMIYVQLTFDPSQF